MEQFKFQFPYFKLQENFKSKLKSEITGITMYLSMQN